jgi:hypothetical protein
MTLYEKFLEIALKELGVHEEGGENKGKRVQEYQKAAGINPGDPWCAAFINWCAEQAALALGLKSPLEQIKLQGYVQAYYDFFKPKGVVITDLKNVKAGDLFLVLHAPNHYGHIGLVKDTDLVKKRFHSVEGNSNDEGSREGYEVCTNFRPATEKIVFIRWA